MKDMRAELFAAIGEYTHYYDGLNLIDYLSENPEITTFEQFAISLKADCNGLSDCDGLYYVRRH